MDDLPSLEEDSDTSEEFEIELARASRHRPMNKKENEKNGQQAAMNNAFPQSKTFQGQQKHGTNNYFSG